MRVLQAMAGADYGGAEAFFTRLVLALNRGGLEQRIVIRRNADRAATLREGGLAPIELAFGGRLDMSSRLALRREIRAFKPDVVLTWMNRATAFCPRGRFVRVGRLGGYYDLKYYRRCDHLIANTEDIVGYLHNAGWAEDRIHHLPNFVAGEAAPPAARSALYTPPGAPLILALGRLHENKAFDVLLHALPKVPDAYLWIAGAGPLRGELESLAQKLGVKPRVRFLGWRNDVASLLAGADVLVCPSRHEPLGNVVIEAWAQGVPVVATDSQGPGALIEHLETGLLVPVDDSNTLGQAMAYLLAEEGLRGRLARGGRAAYENRFTEPLVVGQYLRLFDQIVP